MNATNLRKKYSSKMFSEFIPVYTVTLPLPLPLPLSLPLSFTLCPLPSHSPDRNAICISDYRKVPTKAAFCHHIPFFRRCAAFPCYLSRFTKVRYHNDVPRGSVPAVRSHSSRYSPYRLADFLTRFYRADNGYHNRL